MIYLYVWVNLKVGINGLVELEIVEVIVVVVEVYDIVGFYCGYFLRVVGRWYCSVVILRYVLVL